MMSHPLSMAKRPSSGPASSSSASSPSPAPPSAPTFAASSLEWTASLLSSHSVLDYHHRHQLYPASSSSSSLPSSSPSLPSSTPSLARNPSLRRSESEINRGEDDADAASQRSRGRQPSSLSTDSSDDPPPDSDPRGEEANPLRVDAEVYAAMASWGGAGGKSMLNSPMYQRWVDSLLSFSLSSSSFGCLLDKRYALLSAAVQAALHPKTGTATPLSPRKGRAVAAPSASAVPIAPPLHPTEFITPVWPTLKGLETESWPEGLDTLLGQLGNLPPLQLAAEHTPGEEVMELFARVLSYLEGEAGMDPAVVQSGLSVMMAVAISRASPQHLLHAVSALLHHPTVVFTDAIVPFLTQLASHLNELDISAPFHLSALHSFTITTPSPSTSVSSYTARSPPLSLTLSPSHLFIHSASGLLKVGTGYSGSVVAQHSLHSVYRQHEQLSIACIPSASTLFTSAAYFSFPRLQMLDEETLKVKDFVVLGVDAEAAPVVRGQAQLLTEGRWLYVLEVKEKSQIEEKEKEEQKTPATTERPDEQAELETSQKALHETLIEVERWYVPRSTDTKTHTATASVSYHSADICPPVLLYQAKAAAARWYRRQRSHDGV